VTIITVLDMVRVFSVWQQGMSSKWYATFFAPEYGWLYGLFGMSVLVFAINAFRSYQRKAART
jgi:hypothetical protein